MPAELQALSPEDLLAGAAATFEVEVPAEVLRPAPPGGGAPFAAAAEGGTVQLRPLTIGAFQLILKAARNDPGLIPLLMIKESLAAPRLSLEQVRQLHLGLVSFLVEHVREISGLGVKKKAPGELSASPLVRSAYLLARAFGWTPQQMQEMTMAQVSMYLSLLEQEAAGAHGG